MDNNLKRLSIPYNNDFKGTMELLKKYKHYIKEIYFPVNPQIIGSGRGGANHQYYDEFIKALIVRAREYNIKSNMIINPIGMSEIFADQNQYTKILNYIDFLANVFSLDYITVTNPILAKSIREIASSVKVVASVNMFINSFEGIKKAMQLGIQEFYIDRESNWDIEFIKSVKENFKNIKMRVMLNEGCIPNCVFRVSHFDCVGLMQSEEKFHEFRRYEDKHRTMGCYASYMNDLSLILKTTMIRPEELKYYTPYVETFKVAGRTTPTNINEMRIKAYGEGTYKGDFGLLIDNGIVKKALDVKEVFIFNESFPQDYIERKFNCRKMCTTCGYCESVIKQLIRKKEDGIYK